MERRKRTQDFRTQYLQRSLSDTATQHHTPDRGESRYLQRQNHGIQKDNNPFRELFEEESRRIFRTVCRIRYRSRNIQPQNSIQPLQEVYR